MRRFENVSDAVSFGRWIVNGPLALFLFGGMFASVKWLPGPWIMAGMACSFFTAWLWWSIMVPCWRKWVMGSDLSLAEVHLEAVRAGLLWPPQFVFERTELPPSISKEWNRRLDEEFEQEEEAR